METGTIVLGAASALMWLVDRSERKRERERDRVRGVSPASAPALPPATTRALQPPRTPEVQVPVPPPPVTFTPEQAARFTEAAPSGGRRFAPRFAQTIPSMLGARGAQRVSLGQLPGEAWLVVPLAPGMPVAEALIAERVSSGRACLGSLSFMLLPSGRPVAMLLVFVSPEAAQSMSVAPSDFAILSEPSSASASPVAEVETAPPPPPPTPDVISEQPSSPPAAASHSPVPRSASLEKVHDTSYDEEAAALSRALLADPTEDFPSVSPAPTAPVRSNGLASRGDGDGDHSGNSTKPRPREVE